MRRRRSAQCSLPRKLVSLSTVSGRCLSVNQRGKCVDQSGRSWGPLLVHSTGCSAAMAMSCSAGWSLELAAQAASALHLSLVPLKRRRESFVPGCTPYPVPTILLAEQVQPSPRWRIVRSSGQEAVSFLISMPRRTRSSAAQTVSTQPDRAVASEVTGVVLHVHWPELLPQLGFPRIPRFHGRTEGGTRW